MERLAVAVGKERAKRPDASSSANAKTLAALSRLLFETIPEDPSRPQYRQGDTLGPDRKHWFRAKFGGGRFRLFFRYSIRRKVIVYAWVNDSETPRTYGAKTDAYSVFRSMLAGGNPPDDWDALIAVAKSESATERWKRRTDLGSL